MISENQKRMTLRVLDRIPDDKTVVFLSNVTEPEDVDWIAEQPRLRAALVGGALCESDNPREKIKELMGNHNSFGDFVGELVAKKREEDEQVQKEGDS